MKDIIAWTFMHGYAVYVWTSYGVFCVLLIGHVVWLNHQKKRVFQQLKKWYRNDQRS